MEQPNVVLVIEDEASLREALEKKFSQSEFSVISAEHGATGLEKALAEKPDLILLDIIMPEMDGIEFLKQLRQDDWGKDVPVMVLTNISETEKLQQVMEYGCFSYYVKTDWHINDLVEEVRKFFSEHA